MSTVGRRAVIALTRICRLAVPVAFSLGLLLATRAIAQNSSSPESAVEPGSTPPAIRQAMHQQEVWQSLSAHLPNPATASLADLEMGGDVLRARRFPDKAVEYYTDALLHGGSPDRLLNKLGVTELSLHDTARARLYLKEAVRRNRNNEDAWNNLGATEYMEGRFLPAISAYRKAIKLRPDSATFHANLGTALVEQKHFEDARKEFSKALDLDPEFGADHESLAGISAHVLSAQDHARFCFEMARMYAGRGMVEPMLHALQMASESGMQVQEMMVSDTVLAKYTKDARVVLLVQNTKAMHKSTMASLTGPVPALPAAAAAAN